MARRSAGYSGLQITLHWTIAFLVLFQLIFGDAMTHAIRTVNRGTQLTATDQLWADAHFYVGIALLGLIIVRLIVRWSSGAPVTNHGWIDRAASLSHQLFYVVLILAPILGLLAYYVGDPFGDLHELAKPVLIVLIAIHFIAALYHHFWLKDGTLQRIFVPSE